jgi:hypothetical protein
MTVITRAAGASILLGTAAVLLRRALHRRPEWYDRPAAAASPASPGPGATRPGGRRSRPPRSCGPAAAPARLLFIRLPRSGWAAMT